jgi:anti-sigma B factor antagonist
VSLSIQTGAQGERTFVLALRGEVDYATAQQFREAVSELLSSGRAGLLIVDLSQVSFLDSTGVGTLVVARRICADCGVQLVLHHVNPFIARLFAVLGVSDVLGVPAPAGAITPRRTPVPRGTSDALVQPA